MSNEAIAFDLAISDKFKDIAKISLIVAWLPLAPRLLLRHSPPGSPQVFAHYHDKDGDHLWTRLTVP